MSDSGVGSAALELAEKAVEAFGQGKLFCERRETAIVLRAGSEALFEVTLYDQGDEVMIAADRWHSHYDDAQQVVFCALWLFTPFYRIVHELKGGLLAAVWIERYEGESWEPMDIVGYINPDHEPDWRLGPGEKFFRRYVQHDIIAPPILIHDVDPGAVLDHDGFPLGYAAGTTIVESEGSQALGLLQSVGTISL